MENYPVIRQMQDTVDRLDLRFKSIDNDSYWYEKGFRRINISGSNWETFLLLEDEYKDLNTLHPLAILQLVLMECSEYEEAEDILTWCRFKGVDPVLNKVLDYYRHLNQAIPLLYQNLGSLQAISSFDWELNSGAAQALRKLIDQE